MTSDFHQALLNPQLWRLEAARRRRQLEELQAFTQRLESEYAQLDAQVRAFLTRYSAQLDAPWERVERLQGELLRALELLARSSGAALPPMPPPRQRHRLPELPPAPAWPAAPADEQAVAAPSLKDLHRRAAMRLHPDRAEGEADRARREALMRDANLAYADQDRATLEALLIAAGESPQRLGGFDVHAHWRWLERCEHLAQARLRVLRAHLLLLRQHPATVLAEHVERAQERGLDALAVMAARLAAQAQELQQQLYIGARLQPGSSLSAAFLAQWQQRWEDPTAPQRNGLRAASSAS